MDSVEYDFNFDKVNEEADASSYRFSGFLKKFPYTNDRFAYLQMYERFEATKEAPAESSAKYHAERCDVLQNSPEPLNKLLITEWRNILDRALLTMIDNNRVLSSPNRGTQRQLNLKPAQEFILSSIYSDKSIFVCGPPGSGKTSMAIISILQKMRTVICSAPPHFKSSPCGIFIAPDQQSAIAMDVMTRKLMHAGSFLSGIQALQENHMVLLDKIPCYICGTPEFVIDLIKKNNIDLRTVKYLLVDQCQKFGHSLPNRETFTYLQKVQELMSMLRSSKAAPVSCFLSNSYSNSNLNIKQLFEEDELPLIVIVKPSKDPIDIRLRMITKENGERHEKKLVTLFALVDKFQTTIKHAFANAKNNRPRSKLLVLVNKPETVIYLYYMLKAVFSTINIQFFNRESLTDFVENSTYTWEFNMNGSSFVLVTEYETLDKIEPGYIDQVLCYDLPAVDCFDNVFNSVIDLSSRITKRSVYILFSLKEQSEYAWPIINLLKRESCDIPNLLKDLCVLLHSNEMSAALSKIYA